MRDVGRFGVWSRLLREADHEQRAAACARCEALGFGTLWIPGMAGGEDYFDALEFALASTSTVVVAASILNIWAYPAADVIRFCARLQQRYPDRFLLGLGVSHAHLYPDRYKSPVESMSAYLDALDRDEATSAQRRILGAQGPRMVELARERSLGVHPYNVMLRHTRETRASFGPGPLLAPVQTAVIHDDPGIAQASARRYVSQYLGRFANYERSWRRLGYTDEDLAEGGSDRLIDDLVAWGDPAAVAERLCAHLAAGADHVAVQLWSGPDADPCPGLERLAALLPLR